MNIEKQRIAIAEACGYKHIGIEKYSPLWGRIEAGPLVEIPDYPNDLNAMHEAEIVLTDSRLEVMGSHLEECGVWPLWRATAAHRAEAFLRTIGKWEEA